MFDTPGVRIGISNVSRIVVVKIVHHQLQRPPECWKVDVLLNVGLVAARQEADDLKIV